MSTTPMEESTANVEDVIVRNIYAGFSRNQINQSMDHKRILGPDESVPYRIYPKINKQSGDKRADGRNSTEMRKIYFKTNIVSQAKGSAYIEQGATKVIVSVFDPREIPNKNEYSIKGELYCEFKFAPFSCVKRRQHQQDAQEKEYSVILRRALESTVCRQEFPNFQVDIYALVLQNDGSALSAAISCAGVALAQAGVPMYDLITCVSIAKQGDRIFVDPTYEEETLCNTASNIQKLTYNDLVLMSGNEPTEGTLPLGDLKKNATTLDVPVPLEIANKTEEKDIEHGFLLISMLQTNQQITEYYQTGSLSFKVLQSLTEILVKKNADLALIVQSFLIKYIASTLENEKSIKPMEN